MTSCNEDSTEWSCGICTFLNRPLYLSCEMCGQARPSQRPNPPRRQPSLELPEELDLDVLEPEVYPEERPTRSSASSGRGSTVLLTRNVGGMDRAPRAVQRHHSSTVNITGTLIMTDDPNDYETQDGKKPEVIPEGSEEEPEQASSHVRQRESEEDPTMDESMDRAVLTNSPAHHGGGGSRFQRSRSSDGVNHTNEPPRRHRSRESCASMPVLSSSPQQQLASSSSCARKGYPSMGSNHTETTAQYLSSSSSRIGMDDSANTDDVSEISCISSSLRRATTSGAPAVAVGNSRRNLMQDRSERSLRNVAYHQPHNHIHAQRPNHDIQWRQRNGLPVITSPVRTCQGGCGGGMDNSYGSHSHLGSYKSEEGSIRSPMSTPKSTRCLRSSPPSHLLLQGQRLSSNHIMHASSSRSIMSSVQQQQQSPFQQQPPQHYQQDGGMRGTSSRKLASSVSTVSSSCTSSGDFLPPITPPPVPMVDMPTDVNVMEVFVKDHQAAERRASTSIASTRRTAESVRKDRASMLDNLAARNHFATSNRSMGMGTSTMRMPQVSSRTLGSTRTIVDEVPTPVAAMIPTAAAVVVPSPESLLDSEALDSPNTRKERVKERRKMKGAVRSILATMRISSK